MAMCVPGFWTHDGPRARPRHAPHGRAWRPHGRVPNGRAKVVHADGRARRGSSQDAADGDGDGRQAAPSTSMFAHRVPVYPYTLAASSSPPWPLVPLSFHWYAGTLVRYERTVRLSNLSQQMARPWCEFRTAARSTAALSLHPAPAAYPAPPCPWPCPIPWQGPRPAIKPSSLVSNPVRLYQKEHSLWYRNKLFDWPYCLKRHVK